jgi:purine-nucleoside phosphorylase
MMQHRLTQSLEYIAEHTSVVPTIAIVLGSGLGDFADSMADRIALPTAEIPGYPLSTVEGHKGQLVFGSVKAKPLLAFQGRIHFYESGELDTVLYPIRVAKELGVRSIILTNAAGGLNRTFSPGDLMVITDHINFTFGRLKGFSSSTARCVYSERLIRKAEEAAHSSAITIRKGVYVGLKGPSYETASEVEMLTRCGGDAVGMSTVFEASLASSLGMEVLGISCITNLGTGISSAKLSHAEVTDVGNRVKATFASLIADIISLM